uniref:Uncharacterized protein n=1 Tax=Siphoviridae sp. ctv4j104 TaxID=2826510 RepID=A0A8S5M9P1_9CAUD|nr:MAG TPA: hypothetical protein [Siphoviridae sp. ctv4j104]
MTYQERRAAQRKLLFELLDKEDDGRFYDTMSKKEFTAFMRDRECSNRSIPENSRTVTIRTECEPYHDVSYIYCFDNDIVYVSRYYIGE